MLQKFHVTLCYYLPKPMQGNYLSNRIPMEIEYEIPLFSNSNILHKYSLPSILSTKRLLDLLGSFFLTPSLFVCFDSFSKSTRKSRKCECNVYQDWLARRVEHSSAWCLRCSCKLTWSSTAPPV